MSKLADLTKQMIAAGLPIDGVSDPQAPVVQWAVGSTPTDPQIAQAASIIAGYTPPGSYTYAQILTFLQGQTAANQTKIFQVVCATILAEHLPNGPSDDLVANLRAQFPNALL